MKNKIRNYLIKIFIVLVIISIILSFTTLTFLESLRIVFGSIFVLFLPGFIITHLFFKKIDLIEKIALSFALSIAIVPLTIFYLSKIGVKINTINSILTIIGIVLIAFVIKKFTKSKALCK